ncbi:tetratricopeptide repeat protein [Micromonospora sp. NBC_00821]|uniref:tetratricopeptide repeat protein n=1 Tax=Micromonospora sp. NBC_00821 TaxID=2975977 RepID=UPI002ED14F2E|nr:tetratricopeptide repeat protein [Micromonospora sp. NBC_00821]
MSDAEAQFEMAVARAQSGDLATAVDLFRHASDAGHGLAAFLLGSILKDGGQYAEAERHYRRALAVGLPQEPPNMLQECELSLGIIRNTLGDPAGAEQFYRSAAARGHVGAAFNLGNLLRRTGRQAEAEQVWRQAAAAGSADAAMNLAEMLSERGDLEEAERLLRQAVDGGLTDAITNLANIRLQREDPYEAIALFRTAVAAGDHNAIFNLGIVLMMVGELDEAEIALRRAEAAGHSEATQYLHRLAAARRRRH